MKKTYLIWIVVTIVLLIGIFFMFRNSSINANPIKNTDVQKITLSYKNRNYYPNTITVKQGIPVELTLDNSIGGCYRSFTIKDLGVYKYSNDPSDKITFTPNKQGTFQFACSMHMGTGTMIVE